MPRDVVMLTPSMDTFKYNLTMDIISLFVFDKSRIIEHKYNYTTQYDIMTTQSLNK